MLNLTTVVMGLRAGSEIYETTCFVKEGLRKLKQKQDMQPSIRGLIAISATCAVADTIFLGLRLSGRSVSSRIELALLPVRLMTWGYRLKFEDPIASFIVCSQTAVTLQKVAAGLSFLTGFPRTASTLHYGLMAVEFAARGFNANEIYKI